MERLKHVLLSLRPWQTVLTIGTLIALLIAATTASVYLRHTAKLKLGVDAGLLLTADRQDSLGIFSDSTFTIKSDTDINLASLKNNLHFYPEVDFQVREVSPRQFSIIPNSPLKDNSLYRVQVLSNQRTFSWAFQTKNDFRIVQTLPRDKATFVPLNTGIEITFSHDNFEDPDQYFTITPKAEGRFEKHFRTIVFVPKSLSPDTLYTVTVKKGLKLKNSASSLNDDFIFHFETRSVESQVDIISLSRSFFEFSTTETPAFDIYSTNQAANLTVKVFRYSSSQAFTSDLIARLTVPGWAINANRTFRTSTANLQKVLEFSAPIQKQSYSSYFLFPDILAEGLYLVEISNSKTTTQALVQVTDISAYTTVSGTKTLVWVNNVKSATPVKDASVTFLRSTYKTDSTGVAYFDTANPNYSDQEIISISASQGLLFIPLKDTSYYWDKDYLTKRRQSDKYWSYFYSDRPVYQPDDTLKFWGLLRDRDDLNKNQKFTLEVTRSDYNSWDFHPVVVYTMDSQTSDFGTFSGHLQLTSFTPGWYGIVLKINGSEVLSSGFSVETYHKPAYKITLIPDKKAVIVGDTITFNGQASFFEGSSLSGLDLKYNGPKTGSITTNSKGQFSYTYTPSADSVTNTYSPTNQYFTVSSVNQEEGLITADSSIAVFNSSLAFDNSKSQQKDDQTLVELELKQVNLEKYSQNHTFQDFLVAPNQPVSGELIENEWVKREVGTSYDFINKLSIPRYEYSYKSTKIADISTISDNSGKIVYQFSSRKDRGYTISLRATDQLGRTAYKEMHIYGQQPDAYRSNSYIYLKTDKTGENQNSYLINEPVNLSIMKDNQVISPSTTDRYLYIFSQRGIKSYRTDDNPNISFMFPDTFVPNIIVRAIRFTGKTYQIAENYNLIFNTAPKKLGVDIILDKPSYQPGSEANISVEIKDANGSPVSANVNLNLVDEAYSSLFDTTVNPLSRIYNSLSEDTIASYQSHRYPLDAGGAEGGGCFLPGTQIVLATGQTKNIEDIKVGDIVRTLSSANSSNTVSAQVTHVFKHLVSSHLVINNQLRVTSEHNLYINGRWMTASEVRIGDSYLGSDGRYHPILSIESYSGLTTVYNFTVAKYSTYLADGFYVHNEKGRDLFVDTAYFGSLNTGSDGKAKVSLKLPDNLTSWKIISQAVTNDLKAGHNNTMLLVKQPFFIDTVMNNQYLAGDKPIILARAFGDGLNAGDDVEINIYSKDLGINQTTKTKAFDSIKIDLGTLRPGSYDITFTGKSNSLSDKVTRHLSVVESRLQVAKTWTSTLTPETKIPGSSSARTTITFSDISLGRLYSPLINLSYTWGDRLDQRLARYISQNLSKKYFASNILIEDINFESYTDTTGGYTLFPYSQGDIETSAFTAALIPDKVNKIGLANFFYSQISKTQDDVAFAQSLFGLASLNEPVLVLINNLRNQNQLSPLGQVYLGLAQASIGDLENSRATYRQIISSYAQKQDLLTYIKIGDNKDQYLYATSLVAALSSYLSEPETDSLLGYTYANSTKEYLLVSPQILSIKNLLEQEKPQAVSFTYTLNDKKVVKQLDTGQTFKLELTPDELSQISFSDIAGPVGVVSSYLQPASPQSITTDTSLSVGRSYLVRGSATNTFNASDLVKVILPIKFTDISQDGCYQVTDLLPSGLRPVTATYKLGIYDSNVWYPYEINGQRVSFCIGKSSQSSSVSYYARVISSGDYVAESAIIQSQISPSVQNLSPSSSVTIR